MVSYTGLGFVEVYSFADTNEHLCFCFWFQAGISEPRLVTPSSFGFYLSTVRDEEFLLEGDEEILLEGDEGEEEDVDSP